MAVIDHIEAKMVASLTAKNRKALTMTQIAEAYSAASDAEKMKIRDGLRSGNSRAAGSVLQRIVDAKLRAEAQEEVAEMIADGTLTVAELERAL